MNKGKWLAIVAGALVAGLVLGNMGSAFAANDAGTKSVASTVAACGVGIGQTVRDAGGRLADIVASMTGKSAEEIQAERQAGKSFAQIAEDNGVKSDAVVDKALDVRKGALDDAVKAGTLTQSDADAAYDRMQSRLTDRIDNTAAGCGGGGMGGGGRGGGRGRGGQGGGCGGGGCGAAATQ